ncbi:unnamed protein product, partial [Adineta ricciae]
MYNALDLLVLVGPERPSDDDEQCPLEPLSEQSCEDRSTTLEENLPDIWVTIPEFGALGGPN